MNLLPRFPADMREEYRTRPFDEESCPRDPVALFELWFADARAKKLPEPNAMSLATATADGGVSCRTVLLKAYDSDGFVFFTNYTSSKARAITANPRVALLFPWLALGRQIEITGRAEKIPASESLRYFLRRPVKSRIGAWVSEQSSVIPSRRLLEEKFHQMCQRFADGNVPLPDAWGGYRVVPDTIEFWQGGAHRLHDRIEYIREPGGWTRRRLQP